MSRWRIFAGRHRGHTPASRVARGRQREGEPLIAPGDILTIRCLDCGGTLRTEHLFTGVSGWLLRWKPFWTASCGDCSRRFNYFPKSSRLERIES